MDRTSNRHALHSLRSAIIKILISLLVVIIGYYITFVVFRRTAADSSIERYNTELNEVIQAEQK